MWACVVLAPLISSDISLLMLGVREAGRQGGWEWGGKEREFYRDELWQVLDNDGN